MIANILSLLVCFSLFSSVFGAAIDRRAYAFVTQTAAPVYVTVDGDGADSYDTLTNNDWYTSTQWPQTDTPAATPTPAETPAETPAANTPAAETPAAAPAAETSVTSDYNTVYVSTEAATPAATPETTAAASPDTEAAVTSTPEPVTSAFVYTTTYQVTTSPEATPEPTTQAAATTEATSTTEAAPETTTSAAAAASSGSSGEAGSVIPQYIVYSPYSDDSQCKDYNTVYGDLQMIKSKGINKIRVYATDCNTLNTIQPACKALGMTISQGLWIGSAGIDNVDQSLDDIISWASTNGWDIFDHIMLGNEDVTNGYITADQLVSKAYEVKSKLQAAGYYGWLTTAEVTDTYQKNTQMCSDVFDIVGLNAHSYFDPYSAPAHAGDFVKGQESLVSAACGGRSVWITETGYPSQGAQNGYNVPSKENQAEAVKTILEAYNGDVVVLTTFNDMWKNPGPYGVEQYFGVIDLLA